MKAPLLDGNEMLVINDLISSSPPSAVEHGGTPFPVWFPSFGGGGVAHDLTCGESVHASVTYSTL